MKIKQSASWSTTSFSIFRPHLFCPSTYDIDPVTDLASLKQYVFRLKRHLGHMWHRFHIRFTHICFQACYQMKRIDLGTLQPLNGSYFYKSLARWKWSVRARGAFCSHKTVSVVQWLECWTRTGYKSPLSNGNWVCDFRPVTSSQPNLSHSCCEDKMKRGML